MKVTYIINGKKQEFDISPGEILLDLLRDNGYMEVKGDCYEGTCGACTVLINNVPYASCTTLAAGVDEAEITTVKGLGDINNPHPVQQAFAKFGAVQCGYCTPGEILSAYALLLKDPDPGEEDIKRALDGNLCRCSGYMQQIEAVKIAAKMMREAGDNGRV
ncbi:MAG: (2Fe-2S)-binding protein [Thermoanaerobacteraceae bacterium]|nr:(2Fe-2S)-binding protein [Thermoanaerobacteraceae bacterium]